MRALILVALIAVVSPSPSPCAWFAGCAAPAHRTPMCRYSRGALLTPFVAGACLPSPPPEPSPVPSPR